jgi:hypothetical protein
MTGKTLPPHDKSGKFTTAEEDEAVAGGPSGSFFQPTSDPRSISLLHAASSTARIPSLQYDPSLTACGRGKDHAISLTRDDSLTRLVREHTARDRSPSQSSSSSNSDPPHSPRISQNDFNQAVRNILSWRLPGNAAPVPSRGASTSRRRAASPSNRRQATHATNSFLPPPIPAAGPPHKSSSGVATMPPPKSRHAPHFSGENDDILSEFLTEFEGFADGNGLTEKEKVEQLPCYVPRNLHRLWITLPGYRAFKWHRFRRELKELYPDAEERAYTRQELSWFVELSAETHIQDKNDVMKYYHNFLTIASPLAENGILTTNNFNAEFLRGFHRDDRDVIAEEIRYNVNPRHPASKPFDWQDVLAAA